MKHQKIIRGETYEDYLVRTVRHNLSTNMSLWDNAETEVHDEPRPGHWWAGTSVVKLGDNYFEADTEGYYGPDPIVDKVDADSIMCVDVVDQWTK